MEFRANLRRQSSFEALRSTTRFHNTRDEYERNSGLYHRKWEQKMVDVHSRKHPLHLKDLHHHRSMSKKNAQERVSHIKELEAELARKDSALVFSDRISNERAAENERLVSQLGFLKKEKIDSIRKLLPTVVRRLLSSHEYKESLSVPF
ncbi:hypothetical protein Tco_1389701, partial [Tanacetum coccineum]